MGKGDLLAGIKILGFAGSLRKGSYSRAVLRAAAVLVPKNATLEIFDLEGIPLFNQDLEDPMPARVMEFKKKVEAADAILISTPEQNYSISAVLKNALEWGSRPDGSNSFDDKPAALMTVSTGIRGGVRAEGHLRQIFVDLNMHPINRPKVYVGNAHQKMDANGELKDEKTREQIRKLLEGLVSWTARIGKPSRNKSA